MRILLLFTILSLRLAAQDIPVVLSGDNYIVLNGERFKNKRITFTKAEGDWFSSTHDGHGTLTFTTQFDGRELRMDIEWDGKKDPHIITYDISHDSHRIGSFYITLPDKAVYGDGLNMSTFGDDTVGVSITHIEPLTVGFVIVGVVTQGNEKVQIEGSFNLQRSKQPAVTSSLPYRDCDPTIYDKLVGAEDRSPSECEIKFDLDVRKAIHDAFAPALKYLEANQWVIEEQTDLEPLYGAPREAEKRLLKVSYAIKVTISPEAEIVSQYQKKLEALTQELQDKYAKGGDTNQLMQQMYQLGYETGGATRIAINVHVNQTGFGFYSFKPGTKTSKLPNGADLISSATAQPTTGGGAENGLYATFILMGHWSSPLVTKLDDGSEEIKSNSSVKISPARLGAQNLAVRIECNEALAKAIIQRIDFQKLQAVLQP